MTAPKGLPPLTTSEQLEGTEQILSDRVREALWHAQVQQMRSQEWFNFASDGYLLTDTDGIITEANYAAAALLDVRKEFLLGKPLGLCLSSEYRRPFYLQLRQVANHGRVERWEACLCPPGGRPREVALTAGSVPDEEGPGIKIRWVLQDISQARQIERAWQAEKVLADSLLETAEILILLIDEQGIILRCNPFVLAVTDYETHELCGFNWLYRLLLEEDRHVGRRLLYDAQVVGSSRTGILDLPTRNGENRRVLWSVRRCGSMLLLLGHDVTELQEAQRQALQAERLATIGQMAAGLAHESRNALQRSQACLSLLTLRLQDQPECLDLLGRAEAALDDLKRLFDDVRASAVAPRPQRTWCDLRQIWRAAWSDLAGQPEWSSADLQEDLGESDLFCQVDAFHLKQVFRNLLENALSSGASPVRILLHCRPTTLGGMEALCLRLGDNGPGIPAEVRGHLFEPFFTTKVRGTGLGLAICRRILEAHGGRIQISDMPGNGTEMIIHLPRRGT